MVGALQAMFTRHFPRAFSGVQSAQECPHGDTWGGMCLRHKASPVTQSPLEHVNAELQGSPQLSQYVLLGGGRV